MSFSYGYIAPGVSPFEDSTGDFVNAEAGEFEYNDDAYDEEGYEGDGVGVIGGDGTGDGGGDGDGDGDDGYSTSDGALEDEGVSGDDDYAAEDFEDVSGSAASTSDVNGEAAAVAASVAEGSGTSTNTRSSPVSNHSPASPAASHAARSSPGGKLSGRSPGAASTHSSAGLSSARSSHARSPPGRSPPGPSPRSAQARTPKMSQKKGKSATDMALPVRESVPSARARARDAPQPAFFRPGGLPPKPATTHAATARAADDALETLAVSAALGFTRPPLCARVAQSTGAAAVVDAQSSLWFEDFTRAAASKAQVTMRSHAPRRRRNDDDAGSDVLGSPAATFFAPPPTLSPQPTTEAPPSLQAHARASQFSAPQRATAARSILGESLSVTIAREANAAAMKTAAAAAPGRASSPLALPPRRPAGGSPASLPPLKAADNIPVAAVDLASKASDAALLDWLLLASRGSGSREGAGTDTGMGTFDGFSLDSALARLSAPRVVMNTPAAATYHSKSPAVDALALATHYSGTLDEMLTHTVLNLPRLVAEAASASVGRVVSRGGGADVHVTRAVASAVGGPLLAALQDTLSDVDVVTLIREAVAARVQSSIVAAARRANGDGDASVAHHARVDDIAPAPHATEASLAAHDSV